MTKKDYLFVSLITVFNLLLRLFRLDFPRESFFDERVFYLEAARAYLTGFTDPNSEHPPLGKIIIALGIKIFGDNPWGWRVPAVLFGTLGVVVTYLLAKKIFKDTRVAVLASSLLTFDFLWFVFSRTALLEIFLATLSLIAIYFFWNYYQKGKWPDLVLFSLFLGLAVAVKWSAVFLLLGAGFLLLSEKRKIRQIGLIGLISLIFYLLSYLPYLSQNHSLAQVAQRQVKIWQYHTQALIPDPSGSTRPYLWVLNPAQVFFHPTGTKVFIVALANPVLFWGGLLSLIWFLKTFKKQTTEVKFLVIFTASFYLPWFLVGRYTFFYYFLSALPLLALILARGLVGIAGREGKKLKILRASLLTGNALGFMVFYPFLTALPVSSWYLSLLLVVRI